MEGCDPRGMAVKLLIAGIVLILVRVYTAWDIWIVIGALIIIKAIVVFFMPTGKCMEEPKKKKKR